LEQHPLYLRRHLRHLQHLLYLPQLPHQPWVSSKYFLSSSSLYLC
jgi:hypothetical protein